MCIATTSVCNLFAKPPNSFFTFCPALASRYARSIQSDGSSGGRGVVTPFATSGDKRKSGGGGENNNKRPNDSGGRGGNGNNNGGKNNNDSATNTATRGGNDGGGNRGGINGGSIVNASGHQMKLPTTLSTEYCGHFLDTELRCNFGNSCKKDHSLFPKEFAEGDVKKMLSFVESTRGLSWAPSVQLPATAVSRNNNRN